MIVGQFGAVASRPSVSMRSAICGQRPSNRAVSGDEAETGCCTSMAPIVSPHSEDGMLW